MGMNGQTQTDGLPNFRKPKRTVVFIPLVSGESSVSGKITAYFRNTVRALVVLPS